MNEIRDKSVLEKIHYPDVIEKIDQDMTAEEIFSLVKEKIRYFRDLQEKLSSTMDVMGNIGKFLPLDDITSMSHSTPTVDASEEGPTANKVREEFLQKATGRKATDPPASTTHVAITTEYDLLSFLTELRSDKRHFPFLENFSIS